MAAQVVTLTRSNRNMPEYDPVFFPKEAIRPGTLLVNHGRTDPGSTWRVDRIETYVRLPSGLYRLDRTQEVVHLNDLVHLSRLGANESGLRSRRSPAFGSLSYSAIWRLKV